MHTENDMPQQKASSQVLPPQTGLNSSGFKDSLRYNDGTAEARFYSVETCIKTNKPTIPVEQ